MKQLLQDLSNGQTYISEVPSHLPSSGSILVKTHYSLISIGTERSIVEFGKSSWFKKAKMQPGKVKDVINKVRSEGILPTYEAIRSKLSQPIPLGYATVGRVIHAGDCEGFDIGDWVVTNGYHAEINSIPPELCVHVPEGVKLEDAVFSPIASIGLQGVNLLDVPPGSKILVIGLGLIGQITCRILIAKGYLVLGVDLSEEKCAIANSIGIETVNVNSPFKRAALSWTQGIGVDSTIITANSSESQIINDAAICTTRRGKVISIGVVGLNLHRPNFFQSEVSVQVSWSYGDRNHKGIGSAHQNFSEVLTLFQNNLITVEDLITHKFEFINTKEAYSSFSDKNAMGILLDYSNKNNNESNYELPKTTIKVQDPIQNDRLNVGIIGMGNFAYRTLIPCLKKLDNQVNIHTLVSNQGYQSVNAANQFGGFFVSTDSDRVTKSNEIDTVIITTRHDSHAKLCIDTLSQNKNIWVEKPLCLNKSELDQIIDMKAKSESLLMVGFNRRFSSMVKSICDRLVKDNIVEINIIINAGVLPFDHWLLDSKTGGGRILGEGCHFIDLARSFVEGDIKKIKCLRRDQDGQDGGKYSINFNCGSIAIFDYRTDLPAHEPKEYIALKNGDLEVEIDNWKKIKFTGKQRMTDPFKWNFSPQKGHLNALSEFIDSCSKKRQQLIPLNQIFEVSRAAIDMQNMVENQEIIYS